MTMKKGVLAANFIVLGLTLSACAAAPKGFGENDVYQTSSADSRFRIETVASNVEIPWAFTWLPNGDMLFTERRGRVRIIEKGKLRPDPVFTVPDVEPTSESGLMDITLHPDFAKNNYVYLAYSYNKDGKQVKVVRYVYKNGKFTEDKVIVDHIPGAPNHSGMRCRFGPDGKLYISAGDSTDWTLAQKNDSLAGKILRLNDDGSIPADNPFVGKEGYRPEIWATGVRNPQGLAWQPGTGMLFET